MPSIDVTVFDSTENKRVPVELPDDAPANKLIAVLVEKLKLEHQSRLRGPKAELEAIKLLTEKEHRRLVGREVQNLASICGLVVDAHQL